MFEPENDLERSLIRAVNDPAHRPDFLRRMFNGQTFVALEVEGPLPRPSLDGRVKIPAGAKVTLRTMRAGDQEYVPFFTALSRARAKGNAQSIFSHMTTSDLFRRQSGRQFVLNPGFEHAQMFSSADVSRMLAGQFDIPVAPVIGSKPPAAPAPSVEKPAEPKLPEFKLPEPKSAEPKLPEFNLPERKRSEPKLPEFNLPEPKRSEPKLPEFNLPEPKPSETKTPEFKLPEIKLPESLTAEIKLPELKPFEPRLGDSKPAVSQPFEFKPFQPTPPVAATRSPTPKPLGSPSPDADKIFSLDDLFVFNRAHERTPASVESAPAAKSPSAPPASAGDEAKRKSLPAEKRAIPEVAATPEAAKPVEAKPAAPKPSAPDKAAAFKTAATGALAAIKRFAAKAPALGKSEGTGPASATPVASAERPAMAKPIESEWSAIEKLAAPESGAAKPIAAKPVEAKPVEVPPPRAAAVRAETPAPSVPSKPVAPPAPLPPPARRAAVPPPPGAQICRPDPYPVDVLLRLTSAVQRMPDIESAYLAQVQLAGREPYLLVALGASKSWEPLMQELGPQLRKALPAGRPVEMTPLTGGMFEDYFRNEAQPFFKRR